MTDTTTATGMDAEYLAQTQQIAADLDDRIDLLLAYLDEHDIQNLWTKAHTEAEAAADAPASNWFGCPYALGDFYDHVDLSIPGIITFSGTDRDNDRHTYTIPTAFLFPETRQSVLDDLTTFYEAKARDAAQRRQDHENQQRARDEAEFQRLGRSLGHITT